MGGRLAGKVALITGVGGGMGAEYGQPLPFDPTADRAVAAWAR